MPDGTYLAGPGPGQQQKPDSLAIRPGMFDDIVGPGPDSTTQSAAAPATPPQGLDIRPGMFDDIVGPSSSPAATPPSPSLGDALRGLLPQQGESLGSAVARDLMSIPRQALSGIEGVGHAVAHPIDTVEAIGRGIYGDVKGVANYLIDTPLPKGDESVGQMLRDETTNLLDTTPKAVPSIVGVGLLAAGAPEGSLLRRGASFAAGGALSDLQHPVQGAVGGLFGGELVHQGLSRILPAAPKPDVLPETPFAEPPKIDDMLDNITQHSQELLDKARAGGVTFNPRTGEINPDGFYVGLGNDEGVVSRGNANPIGDESEMTPEALHDIVRQNPGLFQRNNTMLGVWKSDGKFYAEPSQQFSQIDPAFNAGVEKGQAAVGGLINGEYHEVATQGPDALDVYNTAKQTGIAPSKVQAYRDALGQTTGQAQGTNPVAEALERIGSAANTAQRAGAAATAAGVGAATQGSPRSLPSSSGAPGPDAGAGGNDVPPGGGAPPPPREPPAGSVGGEGGAGDEGSRPGPSGYGFTVDEEAALLDKFLHSDEYLSHFLNLSKIGVTGDVQKAAVRGAVFRAIDENRLDPKLRISWEQTQAGARNILNNMTPQELAALGAKQVRESGAMTRDVDFAHYVAHRRLAQEFEGLSAAIRDKNIPITQAHELTDKLNAVSDDMTELAKNMIPSHSEKGRMLNALKIAANQTTDPTYWLLRASKMRDGVPLGADEKLEIMQAIEKVKSAPNAFMRRKWQNLLAAKTYGMKYMTPWQKTAAVYRASLLSSPSSLLGATVGHLAFAGLDAADKNLAGVYDMLLGSITHQRTTPFAPLADIRARWRGMKQAAKGAPGLIRRGESDVQGVVDQKELSWDRLGDSASANLLERATDPLLRTGNVIFGVGSKMFLRMYGIVPHIIRGGAMEASLESQARLIAMSENLGGKLLEDRVRALRAKWATDGAPEQIQRNAWEDGAVAALTNRGYLARAATGFKQMVGDYLGGPGRLATDVAMPFTTVPSNLVEQSAKHIFGLPVAAAQLVKLFRGSIGGEAKADLQRAAVAHMARGSTGAAAMLAGYLLANAGRATGPAQDADRRAVAVMTGRQPNAIRLGIEWYNDARFAPITEMVELGVYMHDYLNNPRQVTDTTDPNQSKQVGLLKGAGQTLLQTVQDAPFAQGVKYISDAITEPGNAAENYARDVAHGLVPTALAHAEEAVDPYVRQPDMNHGLGRSILQTVESRIPVPAVYNQVPVKPNPLGLPTTHETGVVAGFTPYPATADQTLTDPVMKAISESGVSLPAIKIEHGESQAEYQARVQAIARTAYADLSRLVSSYRWQHIDERAVAAAARPDVPYTPAEVAQYFRQQLIKAVVSRAKSRAARQTSPRANAPAELRALIHPTDDDSSTPNE